MIKSIKFSINIQGYRRNIFTYVVPTLLNLVIIGLPWIKKNNIIIKLTTDTLIINSYGFTKSIKIIPVLSKIKELIITPFIILIKGAKKRQKPPTVFKALLKDITKVLRFKITKIPAEIRKLLPAQYHNHLPLFEGDMAVELPPYRPGINHIFTLKKGNNGEKKNPAIGPFIWDNSW